MPILLLSTPEQIHIERELFQLTAAGDEAAFERLFYAYAPRLHGLILKITRHEPVVKDIIQEVFLYLWMDREQLSEITVPQHWIFKIAYNRSVRWLSRQAMQEQKLATLTTSGSEGQLEHQLALRETTRLIQEATEQLPAQAKLIFKLTREGGLPAAEVAAQLNISVQYVRNSLNRSSKSIKTYLADHGIVLPLFLLTCVF